MVNISYIIISCRKIDLSDPTDSLSSSCFILSSPPLQLNEALQLVKAWLENTRQAFNQYLNETSNRFVLISKKKTNL
jgi:hypothetical protein